MTRELHNYSAVKAFEYASFSCEQTATELKTSIVEGLNSEEAKGRLEQYGRNELKINTVYWWQILGRQFVSPFFYLLAVAVVLAMILGEVVDAILISLFILINVVLGFYQEYRSDRVVKLLKKYIATRDVVRRKGKVKKIETKDIVQGDIIILQAGDIVPADIRICQADSLLLDESILTGESGPVLKESKTSTEEVTSFEKAKCLLFSGTIVLSGACVGIAVATGNQTALGNIAALTEKTDKESNFAKGMKRFSHFILQMVGLTLGFVIVVNFLIKGTELAIGNMLIFAIALAVAVIPEALPVVSVFSLSRGALHLAKRKVVVKRLSAIQDLGGITVLCTDKTGTLTENKLTVVEVLKTDNTFSPILLAQMAGKVEGADERNPFDLALAKAEVDDAPSISSASYSRLVEVPFDPVRRRNTVLFSFEDKFLLIARGAPNDIHSCCTTSDDIKNYTWSAQQGNQGCRVLAAAYKQLNERPTDITAAEQDMTLSGYISFEDPIKDTTFGAIRQAQALGLAIKILTGDAPEVAGAVAKKIGLIDDPSKVVTGEQFRAASILDKQKMVVDNAVFARVMPDQKHDIVALLQNNHSVGFFGEGINDAPALKAAGVSLVVQSAADVAREAADIILLKKSLDVIVDGITEGRTIFANTLKYIRATLASNFGNFYAVAIGTLFIDFLPMLPVQILLVNLLTDFPMIAISTDSVDADELKKPQTYRLRDIALITTLLGIVSTVFDFTFFGLYYRKDPEVLQTNWFIASVLTELIFLLSIRTKRFAFKASRPTGTLVILSVIALAVTLVLPYTHWGDQIFHFTMPALSHLVTIVTLVVVYFGATETVKWLYYRAIKNHSD